MSPIHDQGYRRYGGQRTPPGRAWSVIAKAGIRTLMAKRAFIGLLLRGYDLGVYAQIGLIVVIGLAAKNAILIVEFAKLEFDRGRGLLESALEGARLRRRPLLMTSLAFIAGCLPLWFSTGSGAAARQILGTVVVSGMLADTLIASFLIPVSFYAVEKLSMRFGKRHEATVQRPPTVEPVSGD